MFISIDPFDYSDGSEFDETVSQAIAIISALSGVEPGAYGEIGASLSDDDWLDRNVAQGVVALLDLVHEGRRDHLGLSAYLRRVADHLDPALPSKSTP